MYTINKYDHNLTFIYLFFRKVPSNHEFASISAHFRTISFLLSFAASLFFLVRSSLSARRHMFRLCFAPLHIPMAFHMNPRAWHSSSIRVTSAQLPFFFSPPGQLRVVSFKRRWVGGPKGGVGGYRRCRFCSGVDASWGED